MVNYIFGFCLICWIRIMIFVVVVVESIDVIFCLYGRVIMFFENKL